MVNSSGPQIFFVGSFKFSTQSLYIFYRFIMVFYSCVSLDSFCPPKNWSILSKLSNFWAYSCSQHSLFQYNSFYFLWGWQYCPFSLLILVSRVFSLLFLGKSSKRSVFFFSALLKEPVVGFIFCNVFPILFSLISTLIYYILSSAWFEFNLLFFF